MEKQSFGATPASEERYLFKLRGRESGPKLMREQLSLKEIKHNKKI